MITKDKRSRRIYVKQPKLEVRSKQLIEVDGLQFKDLNGNGKLDPYEDWRLSPEERVKDLIHRMAIDEKIGMMMITSQSMGKSQKDLSKTSHQGLLDEEEIEVGANIFEIRSEEHTSELQSRGHLVCRLLLEQKKTHTTSR